MFDWESGELGFVEWKKRNSLEGCSVEWVSVIFWFSYGFFDLVFVLLVID